MEEKLGLKLFFWSFCNIFDKRAKGKISNQVLPENKARQIFRKTNISPETYTYVYLSGGKKCSFFGKFGMLCFLVTLVLRFAILPYYRRYHKKSLMASHKESNQRVKFIFFFYSLNETDLLFWLRIIRLV